MVLEPNFLPRESYWNGIYLYSVYTYSIILVAFDIIGSYHYNVYNQPVFL